MSSKLGTFQRSLGQFRATRPWRQAPSSSNGGASQLFPPRSRCRYNSSSASQAADNEAKPRSKKSSQDTRPRADRSGVHLPFSAGPMHPISLLPDSAVSESSTGEPLFGGEPVRFGPTRLKIKVHGVLRTVEYSHLRDLCRCPECVDQSTKQRNIQTSQIRSNIQPRSYGVKDGKLVLTWRNDIPGFNPEHTSSYSAEDIDNVCASIDDEPPLDKRRIFWSRKTIETNINRFDWNDYVNNGEEFARCMRDLSRYGLVILKGVPDSREMVKQIATKMGPIRNSFYGETWDVRSVQQPKNVAYTDQFLGFHMDLLYMRDPPGYQLLHCLRNSCTGGESLFSDAFRAAHRMAQREPEKFKILTSFKVNYGYKNMDQDYQKTWPTIELTPENERSDSRGDVGIDHINYSPPFQAQFRQSKDPKWNDKYHRYIQAVRTFSKYLESQEVMYQFKLDPGDCVIFENRRVVHARKAFDTSSGERWLAGTYVDEDALRSKFRVLIDKYPDIWNERHLTLPKERRNEKYKQLPTWQKALVRGKVPENNEVRYLYT